MRSFRLPTALATAAFALALSAGSAVAFGPTPPEQQTGSVGPYLIRDSSLSTGARCSYTDSGLLRLERIAVVPPEVRWPDTNSDNDNQHGTVGHRIIVQRSNDNGATWTKYKASALQKKTAYEGSAANLTTRSVAISIANPAAGLRVISKIVWFNKNGTVRGTLKHWYDYSRWDSDQFVSNVVEGPCTVDPT